MVEAEPRHTEKLQNGIDMRNLKRIVMALLFMVGFILLISESDSVGVFLISKGLAVLCACIFYFLWKMWKMDEDDFVKRMTKED